MSNMDKYIIVLGEILHYHYDSCFDKFYQNCKEKKNKKKNVFKLERENIKGLVFLECRTCVLYNDMIVYY